MVEKVEDAEMTCISCDTKLVCHMSTYEGGFENKLQWQNPDSTAHYKWKGAGKFECVIPKDDEAQESSSVPIIQLDSLDHSTKKTVSNEAEFICHIRKEVINTVKKYDADPHPGMIWEMTALIWRKYFGEPEK